MVRCLEKLFGIARPQRSEKGNPIVYYTVYETDKTPYQTQVDKNRKKRRELFCVIDRKLFGLMNSVVIENLDIVKIKFKTFDVME